MRVGHYRGQPVSCAARTHLFTTVQFEFSLALGSMNQTGRSTTHQHSLTKTTEQTSSSFDALQAQVSLKKRKSPKENAV